MSMLYKLCQVGPIRYVLAFSIIVFLQGFFVCIFITEEKY
jgi:hypothetical protein